MSERDDEIDISRKNKKKPLSAKQTYNAVTDTVTGANVRWKDNLFQAVGILFCVLLGAGVGYLVNEFVGMVIGILAGLIGGVLVTGAILMIYRAVQHARGEHD
jgi:F0F1-type ATP synthase assembly protein I